MKGKIKLTKASDPVDLKLAAEKTIQSYPDEWTHVYTDGSAEEATRNAGWGIWIRNPEGTTEELFDSCGENSSNYDAEVYAIQKAIDHVHHKFEDNSTKAKDVVIFTDSKSTLQALEGSQLDESLEEIIHKADKFTSTYPVKLKLQWIPGHVGIYGNEKADALAKKGSQNTQPTIPITLNTAKQKIKQYYRKEWMRHWENGSTGRQV